jgi:uncharacterized protein
MSVTLPLLGDVLAVFCKAPRPGTVKTRLAEAIGAHAAAHVYRVVAEEVMRRTGPGSGEYRRIVLFSPEDARAEMESWMPGESLVPQEGSHLGERMARAFDLVFRSGTRRAVLIGSDVAGLSRSHVLQALSSLERAQVALGPARDGGYYLVALTEARPALFEDIPWSTPAVFQRTVDRASSAGLRVTLLEPLSDIDSLDDVRREWRWLRPLIEDAPFLTQLDAVLAR